MSKNIFLFIIRIFVVSILCFQYAELYAENRSCDIHIINLDNNKIKLTSEIAETEKSRSTGLMHRNYLDENSGMLFIFKREEILAFWMKNTIIPLNIAYINRQGIIIDIQYMKPLDASITYPSKKAAIYALEVNKGWFRKNNIKEGCRVIFNGCLGK
ncbi:MAG: DUF192 domain-containing protein [Spirochaetota bacterium]